MAKVTTNLRFQEYGAKVERAIETALDAASAEVATRTKVNLSRLGRFKSFDAGDPMSAFLARAEGFVDPPGGMPRLRTGLLRRSIVVERLPRVRRIGPQAGLVYPSGTRVGVVARAHELGATINHPGGTPYIVVRDRRTGTPRAVFLRKRSAYNVKKGGKARRSLSPRKVAEALDRARSVKFTRAHVIRLPKRPFLRPSLAQARVYGRFSRSLSASLRTNSGGVR